MFAGPPPPIASSRLISSHNSSHSPEPRRHPESPRGQSLLASRLGTSFFEQRQEKTQNLDSIWRGLQRREKALQREVQQLLDLQASGLVAGSGDSVSERDLDGTSDVDGSSTHSSTFYSTATSKSRMVSSLHEPTRSTPDGNVIPVRQPKPKKPMGLKSARSGLRKAMAALLELKEEEDAHVQAALAQRREALKYLNRMNARKDKIYAELHALEDDEEEPLGKELRELGSEHDALGHEIRELEQKLVAMRNRRRWVREKMDDVKNRREAGLSGYRNSKREVDSEIQTLLHRPPVSPLDLDALRRNGQVDGATGADSPGGFEFLRLRPERRTAQMAKSWWEEEISILERRKAQILADRQALDEGATIWTEVTKIVADFESSLRGMVNSDVGKNGKGTVSPEEMLRKQLTAMDTVVNELEKRLQVAEDKHWNLLICAIGAELEAFIQAQSLLSESLEPTQEETQSEGETAPEDDRTVESEDKNHSHHDESDNEVPPDLLVSHFEDHERPGSTSPQRSVVLRRLNSNEVPPEFLAEHVDKVD